MSVVQKNAMDNELCQRILSEIANGNMSTEEALKMLKSIIKRFKI